MQGAISIACILVIGTTVALGSGRLAGRYRCGERPTSTDEQVLGRFGRSRLTGVIQCEEPPGEGWGGSETVVVLRAPLPNGWRGDQVGPSCFKRSQTNATQLAPFRKALGRRAAGLKGWYDFSPSEAGECVKTSAGFVIDAAFEGTDSQCGRCLYVQYLRLSGGLPAEPKR